MKILAHSLSHDKSSCLYDSESGYFQFINNERISGVKHDHRMNEALFEVAASRSFRPDVLVAVHGIPVERVDEVVTWGEIRKRDGAYVVVGGDPAFRDRSVPAVNDDVSLLADAFPEARFYWCSHHLSHILSAFPLGARPAYGVSLDGGSAERLNGLILKNPFDLEKQEVVYTRGKLLKRGIVSGSFGLFFNRLGNVMGLSGKNMDFAGKIMGGHAYGSPDAALIDGVEYESYGESFADISFLSDWIVEFIAEQTHDDPKTVRHHVQNTRGYYRNVCHFGNPDFADLVSTLHHVWVNLVKAVFLRNVPRRTQSVIFTGGCAQNAVANEALTQLYEDLKCVPHCYDGGLSLGALAWACLKFSVDLPRLDGFPYLQLDTVRDGPSDATIDEIASCLVEGKIVGWHQGAGEIGPRALGNRSILMNPCIVNGKEILNQKVKLREPWRPYAPSVLEEHAEDWFHLGRKPSKYMMRAVKVRDDKMRGIPSVTHADQSARVQTVSEADNAVFHGLLRRFHELSGVPLLLNTSLNKAGRPISGSPEDSLNVFRSTEMDVLCIANDVFKKTREGELS